MEIVDPRYKTLQTITETLNADFNEKYGDDFKECYRVMAKDHKQTLEIKHD